MAEKPILFKTEMVRAILRGEKSMTRRVLKPQPPAEYDRPYLYPVVRAGYEASHIAWHTNTYPDSYGNKVIGTTVLHKLPYQVGDRLWVKETWMPYDADHVIEGKRFAYRANTSADGEDIRREYIQCGRKYQWRPSIFMPKEAARIWLEVSGVRVERLQSITPQDCFYEGAEYQETANPDGSDYQCLWRFEGQGWESDYKAAFAALWDSINAKPKPMYVGKRIDHYVSCPWEDIQETRTYRGKPWIVCGNPWVGVYEFSRGGAK